MCIQLWNQKKNNTPIALVTIEYETLCSSFFFSLRLQSLIVLSFLLLFLFLAMMSAAAYFPPSVLLFSFFLRRYGFHSRPCLILYHPVWNFKSTLKGKSFDFANETEFDSLNRFEYHISNIPIIVHLYMSRLFSHSLTVLYPSVGHSHPPSKGSSYPHRLISEFVFKLVDT